MMTICFFIFHDWFTAEVFGACFHNGYLELQIAGEQCSKCGKRKLRHYEYTPEANAQALTWLKEEVIK